MSVANLTSWWGEPFGFLAEGVEVPAPTDKYRVSAVMCQRKTASRQTAVVFHLTMDPVPSDIEDWTIKVAIATEFGVVAVTVLDCAVTDEIAGVVESEVWLVGSPTNSSFCVSVHRTDVADHLANCVVDLRKSVHLP